MRRSHLWIWVGVAAIVVGLWLARNSYEAFQEDNEVEEEPCKNIMNCRQCAAKKGCGWCRESGKCFETDSKFKIKGGICKDTEFITSDVRCESRASGKPLPLPPQVPDPCRLASSCGDCTQLAACMWCPKQKMCLSMDRYGFPMSGDCHPSTALVYPEQCGMLPKPATGTAVLGE